MIVSPDILRRDTVQLINQIEKQIEEAKTAAVRLGVPPEKLRDSNGGWVMSPLLLAKATAYNTLVILQVKEET